MTDEMTPTQTMDDLLHLGHALGQPERKLAILAEGNISARVGDERMLVKATGSSLASMTLDDLVEVELAPILSLLTDQTADDTRVTQTLLDSRINPLGKQPSVEALLHAVALTEGGATFVCHTHPQSVNSILCSNRADALVRGSLFPDQIVVLGRAQIFLPYVDPGLKLGRAVSGALASFIARHEHGPKAIFLANHGLFALGSSAQEVLQITQMADKVARVLLGALAVGEPTYLSDEHVARIDTRPDEIVRRHLLAHSHSE